MEFLSLWVQWLAKHRGRDATFVCLQYKVREQSYNEGASEPAGLRDYHTLQTLHVESLINSAPCTLTLLQLKASFSFKTSLLCFTLGYRQLRGQYREERIESLGLGGLRRWYDTYMVLV